MVCKLSIIVRHWCTRRNITLQHIVFLSFFPAEVQLMVAMKFFPAFISSHMKVFIGRDIDAIILHLQHGNLFN